MQTVRTVLLLGVLICLLVPGGAGRPRSLRHPGRHSPAAKARFRRSREDHPGHHPTCPCQRTAIAIDDDEDGDVHRLRPALERAGGSYSLVGAEPKPDAPSLHFLWPRLRMPALPLFRTLCVLRI
jgi:hypothetical protein